ncbi:hypothetical protein ACWC2T_23795 [Streptomyces sp. NPDC001393]
MTGDLVQCADRCFLAARQEVHGELLPELESLAERLALHVRSEGLIGEVRFYAGEVPELLLNRSAVPVRMALWPDEPANS